MAGAPVVRGRGSPWLREARKHCAFEFEPLWRCAPYVFGRRFLSPLDKANAKEAARRTAFAWLAAQLGRPLASFDDIADLAALRRAFLIVRDATIVDVARWADAQEARLAA